MPYRKVPRPAKVPLDRLHHYRHQRMEQIELAGAALVYMLNELKKHPEKRRHVEKSLTFAKKSLLESTRDLARVGGLNLVELEVLRELNRAINNEDPKKLQKVINQYTCLPKNLPEKPD